jgi:predicted PurR-regulated permease PerM
MEEKFSIVSWNYFGIVLAVLAYYLIKPFLTSIILGSILAFIFLPLYNKLNLRLRSSNFSALIICLIFAIIIFIPFLFLTPKLLEESFRIYSQVQQINLIEPFERLLPVFFFSPSFASDVAVIFSNLIKNFADSLVDSASGLIFDLPLLLSQAIITFFIMFFILRDSEYLMDYLKDILPFDNDVKEKIFKQSREITVSVLWGQVIMGIAQGLIVGLGLFIFSVPGTVFIDPFCDSCRILPIIGTTIVWVPTTIYLLIVGNVPAAIGLAIFGIISTLVENFVRPIVVSRNTKMNSALI